VGNGDPTDQASDKGRSRKAFSGMCMGLVQSVKTAGGITVEAASPGLAAASVTISAKAVKLRPQVAVWEREIPTGDGVTGVWRPVKAAVGDSEFLTRGDSVFTLRQENGKLAGGVEGFAGGWFGGDDVPTPIADGKVDGDRISFKAGNNNFTGTLKGGQIELERSIHLVRERQQPAPETPDRPAIGPPPDGSDPSSGASRRVPASIPLILRRVDPRK
jgi:beta-galactosidase